MAQNFLPSCNCADLLDSAKCLRDPCVSPNLRQAVQIVLMNYIISALNNTEILTLDELVEQGRCCACGVSANDRDAIWTYILEAFAESVSEAVPDSGASLFDEACRLNCTPEQKDALITTLQCQLFKAIEANINQVL